MKLVPTLSREETYLLCQSGARKEKEKAIRNSFAASMDRVLTGVGKEVRSEKVKDRN